MSCKAIASYCVAAICFLFISVLPVSADTLTIDHSKDPSGGFLFYGATDILFTNTGDANPTTPTDAGMILVDSGGDTWAFCIELVVPLGSDPNYEFTTKDPVGYDPNLLYVEWLLDKFADDAYAAGSNAQGAALQLAIWEILIDFDVNDSTDYGLNLASSTYSDVNTFWYKSTSVVNNNVNAWYNEYINELITALNATGGFTYTSSGNYIVADSDSRQDLIVKVVPEPATAMLLGFGLLGLCAVGRKRA